MEDNRSAVWGGATLGLFVGLILGFFVGSGSYWITVLYAVGIGAASGIVANILGWVGDIFARREAKRRRHAASMSEERFPVFAKHMLRSAEAVLGEHSPADFGTTPNAAGECVEVVRRVGDEEWWRARYDSLDAFYAAHEARHPDIRVYATVGREVALPEDPDEWRSDTGDEVARQIALHRAQLAG